MKIGMEVKPSCPNLVLKFQTDWSTYAVLAGNLVRNYPRILAILDLTSASDFHTEKVSLSSKLPDAQISTQTL